MSGVDVDGQSYRKGASSAIIEFIKGKGGTVHSELEQNVKNIANSGGTPLVVCHNAQILGVIHLKDILKGGIVNDLCSCGKWGSRLL